MRYFTISNTTGYFITQNANLFLITDNRLGQQSANVIDIQLQSVLAFLLYNIMALTLCGCTTFNTTETQTLVILTS